jgi:hypothetical protein
LGQGHAGSREYAHELSGAGMKIDVDTCLVPDGGAV